ncbi:MAG: glycosyltransferase family 1 protein [Patescibacteria group bacterium]
MKIGIHIGSAFSENRTGVEEYAFQLITNIAKLDDSKKHKFILYSNPKVNKRYIKLPNNFTIKELRFPFLWTKIRLSIELLLNTPDVLFIPANFLPLIHPRNSIVTIHGVEFEYLRDCYSKKDIFYLRRGTKEAIKKVRSIIAVSQNNKNDIIKFYNAKEENISVILHGSQLGARDFTLEKTKKAEKYILYIGRIEKKKNIIGILEAFERAKEKYNIPHKLVLLGGEGYGFSYIQDKIQVSSQKDNIKITGYLNNDEKERLLIDADMLLFPSFYEGFGLPILEAQARGVPVITSNISSMPEVASSYGAIFVNPRDISEMADAIYRIYSDESLRILLIKNGFLNIKKYSWQKCAKETLNIITR